MDPSSQSEDESSARQAQAEHYQRLDQILIFGLRRRDEREAETQLDAEDPGPPAEGEEGCPARRRNKPAGSEQWRDIPDDLLPRTLPPERHC